MEMIMSKKKRPPFIRMEFEAIDVEIERRGKKNKTAKVDTLYLRTDGEVATLQYGGEIADEAYNRIEMPKDPDFLKGFAKELKKLAKKLS